MITLWIVIDVDFRQKTKDSFPHSPSLNWSGTNLLGSVWNRRGQVVDKNTMSGHDPAGIADQQEWRKDSPLGADVRPNPAKDSP